MSSSSSESLPSDIPKLIRQNGEIKEFSLNFLNNHIEKSTVYCLRSQAFIWGFYGISKLKKAELIDLLKFKSTGPIWKNIDKEKYNNKIQSMKIGLLNEYVILRGFKNTENLSKDELIKLLLL